MAISVPKGFRLAGVACGIKHDAAKHDLALVVSDRPAAAAGVYTQNVVYAAPVAYDRRITPSDRVRAVVANSGSANACTGQRGLDDARRMAQLAAETFGGSEDQVLVLSTGIIGAYLPMDKIAQGIRSAAAGLGGDDRALASAARAIMTTDTVPKLAGRMLSLSGADVRITGMAKGAGMIGPNMATMLGIVLTDAALAPDVAQQLLVRTADASFNCISVEGHMSTNDTVLLLANGAAAERPPAGDDLEAFGRALSEVCVELARAIPADGEGASHLVTIEVEGCRDGRAARRIAKTVAESALVKTAIAGADPNWGRIVSAAGYAGVDFDPAGVRLEVNGTVLYEAGRPVEFDARAVSDSMRANRDALVRLQFCEGRAACRFWTSDLTAEYVRINADYHT